MDRYDTLLKQLGQIFSEKNKIEKRKNLINESNKICDQLQIEKEKLFGQNRMKEEIADSEIERTQTLIDRYNDIRKELNSIIID